MKRRSRELNIFSMSALDLFASALGAFILITLILMPYYLKQTLVPPAPQDCPVCDPAPAIEPIPEPEPEPEPESIVMDKLLMIQMQWAKKFDVDLHVLTPDGRFYYGRRVIEGRPGNLIHDNVKGGTRIKLAKEIWVVFEPSNGHYKICFNNYAGLQSVKVWGKLLKPTGPINLGPVTLSSSGRNKQKCVLEFDMDQEYNITNVQP